MICLSVNFEDKRIGYNVWQPNLWYNSHIINFGVIDFIFGKYSDVKKQMNQMIQSQISPSVPKLNILSRLKSFGKLHNIIVYIMVYPQQTRVFRH